MPAAGARRRNGNGGGPGHPDAEALSRLTGVWSLANWDETLADGNVCASTASPTARTAGSSTRIAHAPKCAPLKARTFLDKILQTLVQPITERLALTEGGQVRLALKTRYRDGTTHVIFEPEGFIARLAALVPKPRAHLTLSRAQRFKRVFAIDIEVCRRCGGRLEVIVSIEDPPVIEQILEHLSGDGKMVSYTNYPRPANVMITPDGVAMVAPKKAQIRRTRESE